MKILGFASILILSLTLPPPGMAEEASGVYRFLLEDDAVKRIEFDAWTDAKGNAAGQMVFTDETKISDGGEEAREGEEEPKELYVKAELDSLTVEKNRALMSGTILDSSHKSYVGRRVQLVVEDSGEGSKEPDRLIWTFCSPREGGWILSDSEREDDDGASLQWWATDAEREDDEGTPSSNLLPDEDEGGCQTHPLWSYALADVRKYEGEIVVRP
jgi:hypothetical protein